MNGHDTRIQRGLIFVSDVPINVVTPHVVIHDAVYGTFGSFRFYQ